MSTSRPRSKRERASARTAWIVLAVVLVAGLALRLAYLRELAAEPVFATPLADAAFHDYWARGIGLGDWTPPAGESDPRLREVPFLRPPGYPYFLAAIYATVGPGLFPSRLVQMLLGLVNCVLAFLLGRALLGRATGLVAAALSATYWAPIYFEGELQAPVLIQTASLAMLLVLRRVTAGSWRVPALAGGALAGLLVLVRANALLFLPVGAAWIVWTVRRGGGNGLVPAGSFLLAAALVVSPATIRNLAVSGEPVLVSANGAVNLYIGNNETSDGVSAKIPDLQELTGLTGWSWFSYDQIVRGIERHEGDDDLGYRGVSSFFVRRALDWMRENPVDFLRLTAKRALLFWGPDEISNNKAIGIEKANSGVLRASPGFAPLLAISLVGAFLVARRRDATKGVDGAGAALVGLFVLAYFLSFVPFLAAARFRVPLLPLLFLFAAHAIVRFAGAVRRGEWKPALAIGGASTALFLATSRSLHDSPIDEAWWHTDRGSVLMRSGRTDDAIAEFRAALAATPGFLDAHEELAHALVERGRKEESVPHYEAVLGKTPWRNDLRMELGQLLLDVGKAEYAVNVLKTGVMIDPQFSEGYFLLGRALTDAGRYEEGIEEFRRSLEMSPDQPLAWANIGIALASLRRHEEAIEALQTSIELDPFKGETHYRLGRSFEALERWSEALAAYQEAIRVDDDLVEPRIHIGNVLVQTGRSEQAIASYEEALALEEDNMTARYNLAGALGNLGRFDEAIALLEKGLEKDPQHGQSRIRVEQLRRAKEASGSGSR